MPDRPIPTPVLVDGVEVGVASVYPPSTDTPVRVSAGDLSKLLEGRVEDRFFEILQATAARQEFVGEADLLAVGIELSFDTSRLVLHVDLPGAIRPVRRLSVARSGDGIDVDRTPARFSGYLNAVISAQVVEGSFSGEPRVPMTLSLAPTLQYSGYVMESSVRIARGRELTFAPQLVRIVKDLPSKGIRLSVGDALYDVTGFQVRVPLQGLGVQRKFGLSAGPDPRPQATQEVVLEHPSTVAVSVNENVIYESRLPAGRYNLTDFALATGLNRVEIEVAQPDGSTESYELRAPYDADLLRRGVHEFSYVFGVPPYSVDLPRFSGFHRVGLADTMTTGLHVQTDFRAGAFGIGAVWATAFGVLRGDAAGSIQHSGIGGAFALRYQYRKPGRRSSPSLSAVVRYDGPSFWSFSGSRFATSVYHGQFSVSHRIGTSVTSTAAVSASAADGFARFTPGISLSIGSRLSLGTTLGFSIDVDFPRNEMPRWESRIRLSSAPISRRASVNATQDLKRGTTGVQLQVPPARPTRSAGMSARLSGVPGDPAAPSSVSGAATYRGRRITSDLAARLSGFPGGQRGGLASLQVGTAVAFADGAVGISRPIGDAFVLVDRRTRYRDYSVGVNRYGTGYAAVADSLGPAVLPNVASYSPTRVSVETDTLPVGYDLGPADYDLFPGYKSGYRITVGTDATVFASGTIVDRNGDIVGLLAGRLLHLSEGTVHQFFTNRDGEFRIYGLTPGAYQLTIGSSYVGSTRIPDDTDGEIRLGRVTVVEGESGGE